MTRDPLPPGATIGILGGGQLGRMLAVAAAELGFRCHVYCPDPASPAFNVAAARTLAAYEDRTALAAFGAAVDVVTYEFENVPVAPLAALEGIAPLRPSARSLEAAQDRLAEKRFLEGCGIAVAPYRAVASPADIEAALAELGVPAILKTRRLGYDGKGQVRIAARSDLDAAWAAAGGVPSVLEALVPFAVECSSVVAVAADGAVAAYEIARNVHDGGILRRSSVPAGLAPGLAAAAIAETSAAARALGHIGVFTVEWFVIGGDGDGGGGGSGGGGAAGDGGGGGGGGGGGRLIANEIAPRVHNSGHWTQDAAITSQFEQHIRAIAGWPLGATSRTLAAEMENLIGDDVLKLPQIAADGRAKLHLYGKTERRAGRKMGHVNRLGPY